LAVPAIDVGVSVARSGAKVIATRCRRAVYDEPDRFDITRKAAPAMLTFGGGIHYCLGAHLARIELAQAVEEAMRYSPVIFTAMRLAQQDVELAGVTIPAGTLVIANTAAANRDPAQPRQSFPDMTARQPQWL
jgi:cytochrome P450